MREPGQWHPAGFQDYKHYFPTTPELNISADRILNQRFIDTWDRSSQEIQDDLRSWSGETTIVFVRGFLGSFMPGNLVKPCRRMQDLGFDAIIARTDSGGSSLKNAVKIRKQLLSRSNRRHILFCGHSRGALECLWALKDSPDLSTRCQGVIMSQTAYGPSAIIDSMLFGMHSGEDQTIGRKLKDKIQALGLFIVGASTGGKELGSAKWSSLTSQVDSMEWPFSVIQCASWSTRPTTWLDSWHERLGEICPGRAHDGQFYLDDLIWPKIPHVLLPQIDHAQPAVGGYGFDPVKYWQTMVHLTLSAVASKHYGS